MSEGLFQRGTFQLHSGEVSSWKIDCDALTDNDISTLARMIHESVVFGYVEWVSGGGERLGKAMLKWRNVYSSTLLIVDDVLTTGASMEAQRTDRTDTIGAVIFARGACPAWVKPLFSMREGELVAALEAVKRELDADAGIRCLLCHELLHVKDCPAILVIAALSQGELR